MTRRCARCGVDKTPEDFYFVKRKGRVNVRHSWCKACTTQQCVEFKAEGTAETLANATKYREEWSPSELSELQRLTNLGLRAKDIALAMNRSLLGIYSVRDKHGIRRRKTSYAATPGQTIDSEFIRSYIEENVA